MNLVLQLFLFVSCYMTLIFSFHNSAYRSSNNALITTKRERVNRSNLNMIRKIFVGNIPWDISDKDVTDMITDVVGVELKEDKIDIVKNKKGKPRGFMFISFPGDDEANDAVDLIDGMQWGERVLNSNIVEDKGVSVAVRKTGLNAARSVYIKNLEYSLTEDEVWQMCDDIVGNGLVTGVKLPLDKISQRPKGYCHAEFIDEQARDKAIKELSGLEVFGRNLECYPLQPPRQRQDKSIEERHADRRKIREMNELEDNELIDEFY